VANLISCPAFSDLRDVPDECPRPRP
jgi:hypothetical protein